MIANIICLLFGCCVVVQLFYWLFLFTKLAFFVEKKTPINEVTPYISIVICAYNEAKNLTNYLPSILKQDYPNFEVLVVNDASTDNSGQILQNFKKTYPHLTILSLSYPDGKHSIGKKNALAQGIHHAKHEILLLTDADCYAKSNQWAKIMVSTLHENISIGLGYGPYETQQGLVNAFIRYETVYTAIQYMSFALWGIPYMGVGRNMVYKKELFLQSGGFAKHEHIASGDDDLFVNEIANKENTSIVIHKNSQMYSSPKETWKTYFRQKSRHVTTGRHYKMIHQILLGLLSFSHLGLYFFAGMSIFFGINLIFVAALLLVTIVLKTIIFARISNKLGEERLIYWIPLLDVIYILYYILLAPALLWGNTSKWK